ncbi:hypothetical protein V8D89_005343 [Ganoderma adspersum]
MNVETDSSREFAFEMTCSKTACDWCQCRQRRTAGITLKQCAGCKVAWYCSKQCQVAAWPVHKGMCGTSRSRNTVPPIYEILGHATMAELMQETLLGGGVDAALNRDTPRIVIFNLMPPGDYDGTPATAFALESVRLYDPHMARNAGSDPQWSPTMVAIREFAAMALQNAGVDSVLAGMIPITACLRDTQWATSSQSCFPLCRPQLAESEVLDAGTRGTLRNTIRMCTGAINAGIVFNIPDDPDKVVPDMGRVVLEGKNWNWASHERSVLVGDGERRGLADECLRYFNPELSQSPIDCFVTYHRLWPYRSMSDAAKRVLEVYPELDAYVRR